MAQISATADEKRLNTPPMDSSAEDPEKALSAEVAQSQEASSVENETEAAPKNKWKAKLNKPLAFHMSFLSLLLMVFIVSVDATALGVAIPTISEELGGTTLEAFWGNISFLLAVAIMQPIYTSISDVVGRKIPLYAAFFFFGLGSIVFAVAPDMRTLIAGRVIQGLGGGGLDVLNEVIIADMTTLSERAFYIGLMSIPMALGTILGPILGAVFSDFVTWRWIGWINLPLIGLCLPLCIFFLRLRPMPDTFREQLARMDWGGIALFLVGSTLFATPLSWAGALYPWGSWRTIVPLVIGTLVLVVFAWYERFPKEPVMPYRIFSNRTAVATLVGSFVHGLILYALIAYLPLFFQAVFLEAPLQSAVSFLPFCVLMMAFTGFAAIGVEVSRRYTWEIWGAWVFTAVGVGLISLWDADTGLAESAGFQVVAAVGLGTLFTVPPIPMQASTVRAEDQGLAVGILVSFRLFGALIGLAIGATAFSSEFGKQIVHLSPLPEAIAVLENPNEALGFIPFLRTIQLEPEVMHALQDAYAGALRSMWYILAAFGAVGGVISLATKELTIESEEQGKQHFGS